ncbi:MAG: FAD-dependent oxidoreductase [Candidatus Eremiobacteraeota bacterium]|nr:FAD-dependent oxidoreductase [Candidatus Eremiobacteraeota bacterium]
MARTPAIRAITRVACANEAPVDRRLTRADFARMLAAGTAGIVLAPSFTAGSSFAAGRERVAVVGAGIAGLSCAMTLHDAGIDAAVFESSSRVGGRMHSEASYWDGGQHTEWCGSMIDSNHHTMRALAERFRLPLDDTLAPLKPHSRDTAFVHNAQYPMTHADSDFGPVYRTLQSQLGKIGPTTTYDSATAEARRLDNTSMAQWIDSYVPGGRKSKFGTLIDDALTNEYGVDSSRQSALNLVYMLGVQHNYNAQGGQMNVLGYSDQRYNIRGGNQRLPKAIASKLPAGTIRFQHRLSAIARKPTGRYALRFSTAHGEVTELYDRVVLAIPFVTLRGVDYGSAGFDARKKAAIEELGYGMHTKLQMQFRDKPWNGSGPWEHPTTGQIWTDLGFQNSVDFSLGQSGPFGLIERFTAGTAGLIDTPAIPYATIDQSPAVGRQVRKFFGELEHMWPGIAKHWNGKATFGNAQVDPNLQATYSCWLLGQYTKFAGYERAPQGRVHFAGEHCSIENQGFMEGAASTGIAAARELLVDYNIREKRA